MLMSSATGFPSFWRDDLALTVSLILPSCCHLLYFCLSSRGSHSFSKLKEKQSTRKVILSAILGL